MEEVSINALIDVNDNEITVCVYNISRNEQYCVNGDGTDRLAYSLTETTLHLESDEISQYIGRIHSTEKLTYTLNKGHYCCGISSRYLDIAIISSTDIYECSTEVTKYNGSFEKCVITYKEILSEMDL